MEEEFRPRFTLRELFVASTILFLLFALFAPATSGRRHRSRLTVCSFNLAQLAKASVVNATSQRAAFGRYFEPLPVVKNSAVPDEDPSTSAHELIVAWPARLLPVLESSTLWEQIIAGDQNLDFNAPPPIEIF